MVFRLCVLWAEETTERLVRAEEGGSPANLKDGHWVRTNPCSPEGIAEQNNDGAHVLGLVVAANQGSGLPAVGAAGPEGENSKELRESESPLRIGRSLRRPPLSPRGAGAQWIQSNHSFYWIPPGKDRTSLSFFFLLQTLCSLNKALDPVAK